MNSVNRFELIITHTTILPSFTYVEDSLVFGQFYAMSKNQPSGPTVRGTWLLPRYWQGDRTLLDFAKLVKPSLFWLDFSGLVKSSRLTWLLGCRSPNLLTWFFLSSVRKTCWRTSSIWGSVIMTWTLGDKFNLLDWLRRSEGAQVSWLGFSGLVKSSPIWILGTGEVFSALA